MSYNKDFGGREKKHSFDGCEMVTHFSFIKLHSSVYYFFSWKTRIVMARLLLQSAWYQILTKIYEPFIKLLGKSLYNLCNFHRFEIASIVTKKKNVAVLKYGGFTSFLLYTVYAPKRLHTTVQNESLVDGFHIYFFNGFEF